MILSIEQKAGFHSYASVKLTKTLDKSKHESKVTHLEIKFRSQGGCGHSGLLLTLTQSVPIRTGDWADKLSSAKGQVYTPSSRDCTFHQPTTRNEFKLSMVLKMDVIMSPFPYRQNVFF